MSECMICDLYQLTDRQLDSDHPGSVAADLAADIVAILPPRGHRFHKLGIWEETYRARATYPPPPPPCDPAACGPEVHAPSCSQNEYMDSGD